MFGPSKRDLLRIIERERAQHRVEVANLLDRLALLSGRPWTLPPRDPESQEDIEAESRALEYLPI